MINFEYVESNWETAEKKEMRDGFGEAMLMLGAENERLIAITADLGKSLRILEFRDKYPDRYFNVGVAEQNMIGVAAGMAIEGYVPVTCSFAVFSPGRSWDQIRVSIASMNTNVKIVGSHVGLSVGENGASHQSLEDIATMRVLPNMVVLAPADYNQTIDATRAMIEYPGPVYMRFPRAGSVGFIKREKFEIGKAYKYRNGKDISVFVSGIFTWDVMMVAERLSGEGVEVEVINVSTIKPLDQRTILESVRKTKLAVSIEDHQIIGGVGGAIAELLTEKEPTKLLRLGMQNKFGESGEVNKLYEKYGLDQEGIYNSIKNVLHGRL